MNSLLENNPIRHLQKIKAQMRQVISLEAGYEGQDQSHPAVWPLRSKASASTASTPQGRRMTQRDAGTSPRFLYRQDSNCLPNPAYCCLMR
jgi:hypothetical protein